MVAWLSLALCGVLALSAQAGDVAVAAVVLLSAGLLAGAAATIAGSRAAGAVVMAGTVVGVVVALWPSLGESDHPVVGVPGVGPATLGGVTPAATVAVLVCLVLNLAPGRDRRSALPRMAAVLTIGLLAVLLTAWVPQEQRPGGAQVVQCAVAAVAAAVVVTWLVPNVAAGFAAATVVGATAGGTATVLVPGSPIWPFGIALGLTAGVLTATGLLAGRVWSHDTAVAVPVGAVLPLAFTAPAAFVLADLFAF